MQNKALLIIDHGSRAKLATEEFDQLIELVRLRDEYACVKGAHMEIKEPSISEAVSELFDLGYRDVVVVPYFLFSGNHSKIDIPALVEQASEALPEMKFTFGKPICCDPLMVDVILKRAFESFTL
jgi:sirohydrochlorin ferrochelatase